MLGFRLLGRSARRSSVFASHRYASSTTQPRNWINIYSNKSPWWARKTGHLGLLTLNFAVFTAVIELTWWKLSIAEPPPGTGSKWDQFWAPARKYVLVAWQGVTAVGIGFLLVFNRGRVISNIYAIPSLRPSTHRPMVPNLPSRNSIKNQKKDIEKELKESKALVPGTLPPLDLRPQHIDRLIFQCGSHSHPQDGIEVHYEELEVYPENNVGQLKAVIDGWVGRFWINCSGPETKVLGRSMPPDEAEKVLLDLLNPPFR